jgi:hypothetical protein
MSEVPEATIPLCFTTNQWRSRFKVSQIGSCVAERIRRLPRKARAIEVLNPVCPLLRSASMPMRKLYGGGLRTAVHQAHVTCGDPSGRRRSSYLQPMHHRKRKNPDALTGLFAGLFVLALVIGVIAQLHLGVLESFPR